MAPVAARQVVVFVAGFDLCRTQRWGQNCHLPETAIVMVKLLLPVESSFLAS